MTCTVVPTEVEREDGRKTRVDAVSAVGKGWRERAGGTGLTRLPSAGPASWWASWWINSSFDNLHGKKVQGGRMKAWRARRGHGSEGHVSEALEGGKRTGALIRVPEFEAGGSSKVFGVRHLF